jgi:serine/threonine-protein kinase
MPSGYGGRFVLLERIGAGGMAEVWKARVIGSGEVVALKRILPERAHDRELREMFFQEARICARLAHPNLVRVLDFGESSGECWLAMELVDGKNLHEVIIHHLKREQRPPPGLVAYVCERLCRALAYAHALTDGQGRALELVHRDVSPGNVMLGFDGEVKLLDFGVAKLLAEREQRTETGVVKGKSPYMAPERLASLPFDARADLFSTGVFLYEALSGRRLFPNVAPGTVVDSLFDQAVATPPSHHNPAVTPALDAICRRALAREREDRFPDATTMAAELGVVTRELGWNAERAARSLRELFPAAERRPAARRRGRGWRWALPLVALPLAAWIWIAHRSPPVAHEAPAPVAHEAPAPVAHEAPAHESSRPIASEAPAVKAPAATPAIKTASTRKRPHRSRAQAPSRSGPHPLDDSEIASPF